MTPKVVHVYGHSNIERNIVRLYKKYVLLLPQEGKCPALYKYSLARGRRSGHTWYSDKPLSINTVTKTVKSMMQKIGAEGCFTNHSLRVSAATRMFSSGIEEQIVKERTGHRSDAVRAYKHTSEHLLEAAEHAMIGDKCPPTCTVSHPESGDKSLTLHVKLEDQGVTVSDEKSGSLSDFLRRVDERSDVKHVKFEVQFCD